MDTQLTRRHFLAAHTTLAGGVWSSLAARPSRAASERLNLAFVGIGKGGVGGVANLPIFSKHGNVVALCDVDDRYAGPNLEKFSNTPHYHDYRRMLDRQRDIDAVVVSTPDHTHAVIAAAAMRRGKHVYVEKPLTRTIGEARVLRRLARQHQVVTQMGNQGTGEPKLRLMVDLVKRGVIGPVREVHAWTDRPTWPQGGLQRPSERPAVPPHLKWDLFLGPAPQRHYHPQYHPFVWRGWWDFGTCVLGDMACHITNHAFLALDLGFPERVSAESIGGNRETGPKSATIQYHFPARRELPPVQLTWYEGGRQPPRSKWHGWNRLPANGALLIGDKGAVLTLNMYGWDWRLLPEERFKEFRRPPETPAAGHHAEWIAACRGQGATTSNFDFAGRMTESLLVGNLAIRTRKTIEWDGQAMKAANCPEAQVLVEPEYRQGWSLEA